MRVLNWGSQHMTTEVTATVVGGMLKPDHALALADQTRVKLTIEPLGPQPQPTAAWEALKARLQERPIHGLGRRFTRDELHERR
jgi:hypothetical protein